MSTPCQCGASKTLQGCPPCHNAHIRANRKARYARDHAKDIELYGRRKLGRPRKFESPPQSEAPAVRTFDVNRMAARYLSVSLRVGV
jgi:hypothetical protein